jgi:uncharacterized protein (TIGR00369 family)
MAEPDYTSPELIDEKRQAILKSFGDFAFVNLLGIEMLEVDPGRARLQVAWRPDLCQPAGIMHGGVIASLVDTAIAQSMLLTPEYLAAHAAGALIVTVDLRIKYLRPVSGGVVICEARTPRVGRTISHSTATVTDQAGKEVATGDSIYMIVGRERVRTK